ncbi:hypothetical protein ACFFGH_07315 [Lysobacter korlensis]|uniref:Uncharacterized protein n=1 Tax=Lysobacter korlensis TaxID=553636 RepID=A0ABV6RL16_9GAMM
MPAQQVVALRAGGFQICVVDLRNFETGREDQVRRRRRVEQRPIVEGRRGFHGFAHGWLVDGTRPSMAAGV